MGRPRRAGDAGFAREIRELVGLLRLKPHPEGGFYRETYRATGVIPAKALPRRFSGPRRFSTAILYLLPEGAVSKLHRIKSDEVWHYHTGGPLAVVELAGGRAKETILGPDPRQGHRFQHVVPAGRWFGAHPKPGSGFCLVGCTVAPGFDFADFELAPGDHPRKGATAACCQGISLSGALRAGQASGRKSLASKLHGDAKY